jgi:hypothetical protein
MAFISDFLVLTSPFGGRNEARVPFRRGVPVAGKYAIVPTGALATDAAPPIGDTPPRVFVVGAAAIG